MTHAPQPVHVLRSIDIPHLWPVYSTSRQSGSVRGEAFYPLYPTVPEAAERNPALHELLALFDAVRGGSARERALAIAALDERWAA